METSLKTGFAQIFSCYPKKLSCPKFGGAAAPLAPPARTPMQGPHQGHRNKNNFASHKSLKQRYSYYQEVLTHTSHLGLTRFIHYLLKTAALQIYRPLTVIFNVSINKGIFPNSMKFAKVVPIFKQGSRFACSNYRPISVLSSISKIFEKCIFNQLMFYFTNNNMVSILLK